MWWTCWCSCLYASLLIATSSTEAFGGIVVPSLRSWTRVANYAHRQVAVVPSSRLSASFQIPMEEDDDDFDDVLAVGGDPGFLLSTTNKDMAQDESLNAEALGGDPWFATADEHDEHFDQILEDGGDPSFLDDASVRTPTEAPPISQESRPLDSKPHHSSERQHALDVLSSLALPSVMDPLSAAPPDPNSHLPVESPSDVDSTVEAVEEVEAVGGDPWFLTRVGSNGQTIECTEHADRVADVESMGGDPFFLEEED
eukprot:Nitzschia sp. Nitz4//scaffold3_size479765//39954//40721//NITZ4_000016-RA/size479765-processed-gene-0.44-mRNA-1//1//CDS//3329550506//5689//frame0